MSTVATPTRKKAAKPAASAKRQAADEAVKTIRDADAGINPTPAQIEAHLRKLEATLKGCRDTIKKVILACDISTDFFQLLTMADHTLEKQANIFSIMSFTEPATEELQWAIFSAEALLSGSISLASKEGQDTLKSSLSSTRNILRHLFNELDIVTIAPYLSAPPQPTAALPTASQCGLTSEQQFSFLLRLEKASAIMKMLVHVFGGDAGLDEPSKVEGLMGTLQQADNLLSELNLEILAINGDLPGDLRWRTFEAAHMIQLVERLQFAGDYDWRLSDAIYCSYFDAASNCIDKAKAALQSVKTKWPEAA